MVNADKQLKSLKRGKRILRLNSIANRYNITKLPRFKPNLVIKTITMKVSKPLTFLALSTLILVGCTKVRLPNSSLEKLFGNWRLIESSGGFAGTSETYSGNEKEVEFQKNGVVKRYTNGDQQERLRYKVIEQTTVDRTSSKFLIEYQLTGFNNRQNISVISDFVEFRGNDTLLLINNCTDCYTNMYVRN